MQRQRVAWLLGGTAFAATVAAVAGIALSCLPDLEQGPPPPGSDAASLCGNGRIDVDSGEQCDPGIKDGSVPGCSRDCRIECDAGAPSLSTYFDPSSNHCYFLLSADAGPYEAGVGCAAARAHVITLGGPPELTSVSNGLHPDPGTNQFWLGDRRDLVDAGIGPFYRTVIDEPGFTYDGGGCPGCFVKGGLEDPKRPKENPACVTWSPAHFFSASCDVAGVKTICEREPPGSRGYECNGLECFDVQYNAHNLDGTIYKWSRTPVTAEAAVALCASLGGDGGTGSLVIFEYIEQREQIFYELMHLPKVPPDAGPPTDFWIGLSSSTLKLPSGSRIQWKWDNGKTGLDIPVGWGEGEPMATKPGVRAYASQTSTAYDLPAVTFDTQLVHAHDPSSDGGTEVHAVLCQVQP